MRLNSRARLGVIWGYGYKVMLVRTVTGVGAHRASYNNLEVSNVPGP